MKGLYNHLDYFSQPVQLMFDNERKYSSVIGKFLSIIIYIMTIILIINSWDSLTNRRNPKTSTTNFYIENAPLINFTKFNPVYIPYLLDINFNPIQDSSYLTIEMNQFMVNRYQNGSADFNYLPLKKSNCSVYKEVFRQKNAEKEYYNNFVEQGVCTNFKDREIIIGGTFTNKYFSNINIRVKRCQNSSESSVVCKSPMEIDQKIKGSYFQLYYFGNSIDLNNYDNIFYEYFKSYFLILDNRAKKSVDIFFKVANVSTDAGYVFEFQEFSDVFTYDYVRELSEYVENNDILLDFYINSSSNYSYYTRSYLKFQEFAASIGGLLKLMTVIGTLISSIFIRNEMNAKILNSIFKFDFDTDDKKNKITPYKDIMSKDTISNNILIPVLPRINFPQPNLKLGRKEKSIEEFFVTQMKSIKKDKSSEMSVSCIDIINIAVCICSRNEKKKKKVLNYALEKMTDYLDLLKIIKFIQELRKLKKIIFSESQNKIFSLFSMPIISLSNLDEENITTCNNLKPELNDYSLFTNYCDILNHQEDCINRRLLQYMEANHKVIFDKTVEIKVKKMKNY